MNFPSDATRAERKTWNRRNISQNVETTPQKYISAPVVGSTLYENSEDILNTGRILQTEDEVTETPRLFHSTKECVDPPSPLEMRKAGNSCPPLPAMLTVKLSNGSSRKLRFQADVPLKTILNQKALLNRMGIYLEDHIVLDEATGVLLNLELPLKPEISAVVLVPKAVKRRKGPTASGSGNLHSPCKQGTSSSSSSSLGLTKHKGGFGLDPNIPKSTPRAKSGIWEKEEKQQPRRATKSKTNRKGGRKFGTVSSEDDTDPVGKKKKRQMITSIRRSTIMAVTEWWSLDKALYEEEIPPEERDKPIKGKKDSLYKRTEARKNRMEQKLKQIYEEYEVHKNIPLESNVPVDMPLSLEMMTTLGTDNLEDTCYTLPSSSPLMGEPIPVDEKLIQTMETTTTDIPSNTPRLTDGKDRGWREGEDRRENETAQSPQVAQIQLDDNSLNERFQRVCVKLLQPGGKGYFARKYQINKEFVAISKDFLFTAHNVGRLIISEVYLSEDKKTIKPVTMGGYIGGDKYLVKEILFKFALKGPVIDDDEVAMKIAGHELRSLNHLVGCNIPDVYYPLQCIIDFLGFRVVAMLYLPIGKDTLKIGSSDGGLTYHYNDANLAAILEKIGKQLGLAPHFLHGRTVSIAGDVEGHKGRDNRYYIIDLSRTFPPMPELKQTDNKYSHLYKMFRPEFVKMYSKIRTPLCSDGFSGFVNNITERKKFDDELIKARDYFIAVVIPNAARNLDVACMAAKIPGALTTENPFLNLCVVLHRNGVNLRFMRHIYYSCLTAPAQAIVTIEMVARTIKKIIFKDMREKVFQTQSPMELPYLECVCLYLNNVFKRSPQVWSLINKLLCTYYDVSPKDESKEFDALNIVWNFDPRKGTKQTGETSKWNLEEEQVLENDGTGEEEELYSGPKLLFAKLQKYLGINYNEQFLKLIYEQNVLQNLQDKNLMSTLAISSLSGTVKHLYVISHAEGYLWKSMKDTRLPDANNNIFLREASSMYCNMVAAQKFDQALVAHPNSVATMRSAITCRYKYWLEVQNNTIKLPQLAFVSMQFRWAQELDVNDGSTATMYFEAMKNLKKYEFAEDVLVEFLQHHPLDKEKKNEYTIFLNQFGLSGEVERFLQLRQALKEKIRKQNV